MWLAAAVVVKRGVMWVRVYGNDRGDSVRRYNRY